MYSDRTIILLLLYFLQQNFPYADDVDKVDMRSLMMTVILLCLIILLIKVGS